MHGDRRALRVVKFGGSSFLELSDYRRVAAYLVGLLADDSSRVLAVVSGMSGTTGRLLDAARAIDPDLQPQVQDQVLATAEMVSASFLRAALNAEGCPAIDLWAPQIGIRSDDSATRAKIVSIDPEPVRDAFSRHRVVVVAGGQAVQPDERITMLGRNSSDLSAVALAAALGVSSCEIFSDVSGVYSADPYVVPSAKLLPRVSYQQCVAMAASGAKVLHGGSVAWARHYGVAIVCRALVAGDAAGRLAATTGTVVGSGRGETAVVGDRNVQLYQLVGTAAGDWSEIDSVLAAVRAAGLGATPTALGGQAVLAFGGGQTGVAEVLAQAGVEADLLEGLGLVSVVCPDGRTCCRLVPLNRVDATVRQLHAQAHGAPAAEFSTAELGNGVGAKRRSAHSGLLSGGPTLSSVRCV